MPRTTVLILEYVTGGGYAGQDLPPTLAAEGGAIRRALVADFAAVPGVEVVAPIDGRLAPESDRPGVVAPIQQPGEPPAWEAWASRVDWCLVVAPELDGLAGRMARRMAEVGGRSLGAPTFPTNLMSDKGRLARAWAGLGWACPTTLPVNPKADLLPKGLRSVPAVVKPRRGAGAIHAVVVRDGRRPAWVTADDEAIAQPYLPGTPMSASYLVDRAGVAHRIAIGRQRIEVDDVGRIGYRGGVIPAPISPGADLAIIDRAAVGVGPGHRPAQHYLGFVGVDFLDDPTSGITLLELNLRPTTSIVGLTRLLPPGTIAGAWLAAASGPLAGTGWPERLRVPADHPPVTFDADGTVHPAGGEVDDAR